MSPHALTVPAEKQLINVIHQTNMLQEIITKKLMRFSTDI
jgi:hypothetical protein